MNERASLLTVLMSVEVDGAVEATCWRIGGRPLEPEEAELVARATPEDLEVAAGLLRTDAELDLAAAHPFTLDATRRDVCARLGAKLVTRLAPGPASELVNGLEVPEAERRELIRLLGIS